MSAASPSKAKRRPVPRYDIECVQRTGAVLGETPLWDPRDGRLWWIDIDNPTLHALDPASGVAEAFSQTCGTLGGQALRAGGGRLLARDLTLHATDPASGRDEPHCVVPGEITTLTRLNDGRVDARGRFWIGTMDHGLRRPIGALYRVDSDGGIERFYDDVIVSNGIAFAPDGRHLWFTETRRHMTWKIALDAAGDRPVAREVFADYGKTGDRPDGACVDAEGCLWQAFFAGGRVKRYAPDGRIDREIALPITNPTCLCFGGREYRTLFVTSAAKFLSDAELAAEPLAGSVFAIEGAGQGLAENMFGSARG